MRASPASSNGGRPSSRAGERVTTDVPGIAVADVFSTEPPAFAVDDVVQRARASFGVEGRPELLASERDQNVRLVAAGRSVVVKIANLAEDRATLELQTAALDHLARVAPDLSVPRVVPVLDGGDLATWDGHLVRCVTHLPGAPARDGGRLRSGCARLGAGRVHGSAVRRDGRLRPPSGAPPRLPVEPRRRATAPAVDSGDHRPRTTVRWSRLRSIGICCGWHRCSIDSGWLWCTTTRTITTCWSMGRRSPG